MPTRLRRERPGYESDRIYYAPGPAAAIAGILPQTTPMAALPPAAIAGRAAAIAGAAATTAALVPAALAGRAPPDVVHTQAFPAPAGNRQELPPATDPPNQKKNKRLLLISERDAARADDRDPRQDGRPTHDGPKLTDADLEVARMAMTECLQRAHPGAAGPFRLDDSDVRLVAACAAAVTGNREAKLQALRDAIDGAYRTSHGAPRVRFIWGKLEHFLRHAADGRRARLACDPELRNEEPAPAPTRRARRQVHAALAGISPEEIAAGMARVFGPGWKPSR